ncbi:(d)CMP kinase [Oscillibacter sp.]|uniref:(d)CMP kinase n=1 Tax=Oscillibacter sp. TaxID=1945593 RepID=UPI0026216B47|nr:(d)CMP kinase [Oscillibacter sp.]MDD3346295.1 (d)CMP kinase [Oscillibacter sp.]
MTGENHAMKAIAIDGPSGAGKSTLARSIAKTLGYLYVDTGAIYRTIGCFTRENRIDPKDEAAVLAALPRLRLEITYGADGLQHMLLRGRDVTEEIRLPEMSLCASAVSAHPGVRAYLLEMQRRLARENNVVMDGRDIGTVVLPEADVKVFLTASPEERARRRMLELEERGTPQSFETILREIGERDWNDTHRAAAPLRQAEDAVALDTTGLSFRQSEEALLRIIKERIPA